MVVISRRLYRQSDVGSPTGDFHPISSCPCRAYQEDFSPQFCEPTLPPKNRWCRQIVNNKEACTSTPTEQAPTESPLGYELHALRPLVIVHPQPMDTNQGEDPSSVFRAEHPIGRPESLSVEQGIDEAVKDQPLDRALVSNISSLPEKEKTDAFLTLDCFKQGWRGIDEAVKDQPLDRDLLSKISAMSHAKGFPEKAKVEALLKQRSENTRDDKIIVIKEEATGLTSLPHRINDQAPLWMADQSIKREVCDSRQIQKTFFSQIGIPNDRAIRKSINESIAKYQSLDDEQKEQYLNERMSVQKHEGSFFSELKDHKEVVASRDILQWELLGHYAGKQYHDNTYQQGACVMGPAFVNIERFNSFAPTPGIFISTYRQQGNITSLINAYSTHTIKGKNSPEQNVSFLRHRNQQGQWMVFIIAIKPIPANESLWIDYGEQ
ncbi:SET domain-containing protein [Endozoicomonas sp. SCSIO W0465]|uniref:SET domain-containing protein n=1 Tax=Endozoicomonas sp. SCSIO W0465 TaxID=2918516 RepID=UPI0020763F28|nr:SET domain-containing protein [Endozoicomonas sp. SCSIO W0465]USE33821.1 SET domain-containing protein [Endozoicomonas sp. SCSIO W0465]